MSVINSIKTIQTYIPEWWSSLFNSKKKKSFIPTIIRKPRLSLKQTINRSFGHVTSSLFQNMITVFAIFFTIFILSIFMIVYDNTFKENEYITDKVYVKEGMVKEDKERKDKYLKDMCTKQKSGKDVCSKNDKEKCIEYDCCNWVKYNKKGIHTKPTCVKGGRSGPALKKQGNIGFDEYYFKNKRYNSKSIEIK